MNMKRATTQNAPWNHAPSSRLVSLTLVVVIGGAIAGPALATAHDQDEEGLSASHHDDGSQCPDGDGAGPCHDGCPCLCCPGHASVIFILDNTEIEKPFQVTLQHQRPSETSSPEGVPTDVFRPPRS